MRTSVSSTKADPMEDKRKKGSMRGSRILLNTGITVHNGWLKSETCSCINDDGDAVKTVLSSKAALV